MSPILATPRQIQLSLLPDVDINQELHATAIRVCTQPNNGQLHEANMNAGSVRCFGNESKPVPGAPHEVSDDRTNQADTRPEPEIHGSYASATLTPNGHLADEINPLDSCDQTKDGIGIYTTEVP